MSYTPYTWADGQNGAAAVAHMNNIEEGIRVATAAAEDVAGDYASSDSASLYSRASALLESAQQGNTDALAAYNTVVDAQSMLAKRNTIATINASGGVTGPGTDLPAKLSWEYSWGSAAMLGMVQTQDAQTLIVLKSGWYMFHFMVTVNALNATLKIKCNGEVVETLKLAELPLVTGYVDYACMSACVSRYIEANSTLGITVTLDGFTTDVKSHVYIGLMLRRM